MKYSIFHGGSGTISKKTEPRNAVPLFRLRCREERKAYEEQIEELKNLDSFPVDYSDIPKRTDFSKAKFKYYELKPKKEVVTIRLDADLLAVLRPR